MKKGSTHTPETRKKLSLSHLGHPAPKSAFKKGFIPWNKGLKVSTNTGRTRFKSGQTPFNKGIKGYTNSGSFKEGHGQVNNVRGERHPFWRGGITTLNHAIRNMLQYRQWRSDVYTRDDFVCQSCGKRGGKLEADHIKPFSKIVSDNNIKTVEDALNCEELWNINNGRTLCKECHWKTDNYGSKAYKGRKEHCE
jgi:5-methylcytosine-specific restriction endonuclease McrA